jgi:hypothetical protein
VRRIRVHGFFGLLEVRVGRSNFYQSIVPRDVRVRVGMTLVVRLVPGVEAEMSVVLRAVGVSFREIRLAIPCEGS